MDKKSAQMVTHQNSELVFRKLIENGIDPSENILKKVCAKLVVNSSRKSIIDTKNRHFSYFLSRCTKIKDIVPYTETGEVVSCSYSVVVTLKIIA